MALTPSRALAVFVVGAAAILAGANGMRDAAQPRAYAWDWYSVSSQGATALARAVWMLERRDSVVRSLENRPVRAPFDVRVSELVGAADRDRLTRLAHAVWDRLEPGRGLAPTLVVFAHDSTTHFRDLRLSPMRLTLMPDQTDGRACIVVVRGYGSAVDDQTYGLSRALAPCAFLSRYGLPGRSIGAWLRERNYVPVTSARPLARGATSAGRYTVTAQLLANAYGSEFAMSLGAVACVGGRQEACGRAWDVRSLGEGRDQPLPAGFLSPRWYWQEGPLGRASSDFLAQVENDVGPERFAAFWRSNAPVDSALVSATGRTLAQHSRVALTRSFGRDLHLSPWPSGVEWLVQIVLLGLTLGGLFVLATRRQINL